MNASSSACMPQEAPDEEEIHKETIKATRERLRILQNIPNAFLPLLKRIVAVTGQDPNKLIETMTIEHFKEIQANVDQFIDSYDAGRGILSPQDIEFLKAFTGEIIAERNFRADEIDSMQEAAEIQKRLLPVDTYGVHCIDGRTALVYFFGIVGRVPGVGATALPAGDMNECIASSTGEMTVAPGSHFAQIIDKAFETSDVISQVLDSHIACARRKTWENELKNQWADDGVMVDVIRKKKMAEAMTNYAKEKGKLIPIQISFDPHNGYLHMGLEKESSLEAARANNGFTHEVLKELAEKGEIISTQELAKDPIISGLFAKAYEGFDPKPNFRILYKDTGTQFWKAMEAMAPKALPVIKKKLSQIYPDLKDETEIAQRAILLLASAFSGFCNNAEGHYPFAEHKETFVSVTRRDFKPFPRYMAFAVASTDRQNIPDNTVFAGKIVRDNRNEGRVSKHKETYGSKEAFVRAPITVMVKEIVEVGDKKTPIDWKQIDKIDWSFVEKINWIGISSVEFQNLLIEHGCVDLRIAKAVNHLRKNMAAMCNWNTKSAHEIMDGRLVPFPVLCDESRRFRAIIPFRFKGIYLV